MKRIVIVSKSLALAALLHGGLSGDYEIEVVTEPPPEALTFLIRDFPFDNDDAAVYPHPFVSREYPTMEGHPAKPVMASKVDYDKAVSRAPPGRWGTFKSTHAHIAVKERTAGFWNPYGPFDKRLWRGGFMIEGALPPLLFFLFTETME